MIPATIQLAGIDIELIEKSKVSPGFRKAYQLKEHMEGVKEKYDYIIIDCPPSLGMITTNALTASDSVIIPVQCEFFALEGITQLLNTIMLTQKNLNPNLDLEGVLLTMLSKSNLGLDVIEEIRTYKYIQEYLCDKLSTKVRVTSTKVIIDFSGLEDFNRIMEILGIEE